MINQIIQILLEKLVLFFINTTKQVVSSIAIEFFFHPDIA